MRRIFSWLQKSSAKPLPNWQLKKEKQGLAQTMFIRGGELLTWTDNINQRWKEHFEEFLNLATMSSVEEARFKDSWEDFSISLAEVADVVKKLLRGQMSGMDEIHSKMLKALDIVGLSFQCKVEFRDSTCRFQTKVVVSVFKKGDWRMCFNYQYITLIIFPQKAYVRVLERKKIQEKQCRFHPGQQTTFLPYVLCGIGLCPPRSPLRYTARVWGAGLAVQAIQWQRELFPHALDKKSNTFHQG